MKKRFAVVLLFIPCCFIDGLSLPIVAINWIITGNVFDSMTEKLVEQKG